MDLIISYIAFPFLVLIFFTFPGEILRYFIKKTHKLSIENIIFSTIIGYALITIVTYFSLYLKLGFLPVVLLLFSLIFVYKKDLKNINLIELIPIPGYTVSIVLILGVVFQMLVIAPSGIMQNGDLVFWSSHGHDASWHIAVMNEIAKGFPLENPVYAGEKLVNYHYFFNIMPAMFTEHLGFSSVEMYFRMFPLLFSMLLGSSAFYLGKKVGKSTGAGLWSMFFVLFAGSFGYIVTFIKGGTIGGESIFWATQPHSSIGNPPQIISNLFVLTFLYFFYGYFKDKSKYSYVSCILIAGVLSVFKVYAAVALLIPLGILSVYRFLKEKNLDLLVMTTASGFLSASLYLPNTAGSAGFLIFEPWWYVRTMVVLDSRLDWLDMELRRQTFLAHNNYLRVLQLELTAFIIFLIGNIGIRLIGVFYFVKDIKNIFTDYFKIFILLIITFSIVLPLLFLQKGVASNTAQFLQYYVLVLSIAAAIFVNNSLAKLNNLFFKLIIVGIIVLLSIPTQAGLINEFYNRPAFAKISHAELQALDYIQTNTNKNAVLIVPPYDSDFSTKETTPQIWDWFDTSYVSAFSDRSVYFADYEQMDIMGYNISERQEIIKKIFNTKSPEELEDEVVKTDSDYLYFPKLQSPAVNLEFTNLKKVYSNEEVEIWKI